MEVKSLEKMIETGRDSAMLRLTLAGVYQQQGNLGSALEHLQSAVQQDPDYTAAWKALGRVQLELADTDSARKSWQQGITVAEKRGDKQAQKEMQVFLKRLDKAATHSQK